MKKFILIVLAIALVLSMVACSKPAESDKVDEKPDDTKVTDVKESDEPADNTDEKGQEDSADINVDKGLFDVEVTLPATLFADQDIDEVIKEAKEGGVGEITKNADGSLTYKMSKKKYNEMMAEVKENFIKSIEELKSGDLPSIKDIKYNDDFSEFTLIVEKEKYEGSFDSMATFSIGMVGVFYRMYTGEAQEDIKVKIEVKDEKSGEVFDTVIYPDAMEDLG